MDTLLMTQPLQTQPDMSFERSSSDLLLRLEAYDIRLKRLEARAALLSWTSSVVGLPISHISQVQNGAVFCYILSALTTEQQIDLTQVNFLAIDEAEYTMNFELLQKAISKGNIHGLNKEAKLRDWLRLATSRSDAWFFLELLRTAFKESGLGGYSVDIECDATPPPPPLAFDKAKKKAEARKASSILATQQWLERPSSMEKSRLAYRAPTETSNEDIGDLVLSLTEAWTRQDGLHHSSSLAVKPSKSRRRHKKTLSSSSEGSEAESLSENASTKRANSILKSMLSSDACGSLCSRASSMEYSQRSCSRTNSNASSLSMRSSYTIAPTH